MDQVDKWLADNRIEEVEGVVPDMSGIARGKFVPAKKFSKEEGMRLPESIFIQTVNGDFVMEPVISLADRDMVVRPDVDTLRPVPWATDPTASVIQDCFHFDGSPVEIAPRYVLKRVLEMYKEHGLRPVVAPEVEFYLVKPNTDPDYPLEPPVGRSGRATARQPYSIDAVNEFEPLFEDIYDFCEAQEIEIDTLIHEAGAAQVEINFLHGDPLSLADQVFRFKRTAREAAMRHDVYATFMAKPMAQEPGSALHLHQSVVRVDDDSNIFSNPDGSVSDAFHHFIGGQQEFIPKALLLFAPYANSYRRFARYLSAPINIQWGYDNRTVGLRVPESSPKDRRVENRVAGADVNPYLAIAGSLLAGFLGIKNKIKPKPAVISSAYELPHNLAKDMFIAMDLFQNSEELREALGEHFVEAYVALKSQEYGTFFDVISPWEREFLLLNV